MPRIELEPAAHIYQVDGRHTPGVSEVLQDAGLIDRRWFTDGGAERGKMVHVACQYLAEGDLDWASVSPMLMPYLEAYQLWLKQGEFRTEHAERHYYSEALDYCGTPDVVGCWRDRLTVVDFKSGQVPAWTVFQLAAYGNLVFEDTGVEPTIMSVQLGNNGRYKTTQYVDRNAWNVFKAALVLYRAKRLYKIMRGEANGKQNGTPAA